MTNNSYLVLFVFLCLGFSSKAQNLTDNPANYQQTAPLNQLQEGLPISSTTIFGQIDSTITTVLCDSGMVSLVGTGIISSSWSTDSLGTNVITTSDTFNSGLLTSDTSFYHTSISDSTVGSPTLPPQTGTYNGSVRGYYFVAPIDMVITGFWVPTDANPTAVQHVEFLRFATAPPLYTNVTNDFTSLGSWRNYNALDTIPTNIQVYAGDTLGIYGNRGDINSYGSSNDIVIDGITTPIYRSGMQYPLSSNPTMFDVWSQAAGGSISRVEFFYIANSDTVTTQHSITVGQSYSMTQAFTACNGDSVTYNSVTYAVDTVLVENLSTGLGCDSIITTNITIAPALVGNSTATICNSDSVVVNGTVYNAANATGTEVFTTANGCDSTVSINLTVIPTLTGSFSDTICNGDSILINGTIYDAANATGTEVLTSVNGCDSTVSVSLGIQSIDVSTSVNGLTITANQVGATYQWVDCNNANAPIAGETNSSYTVAGNGDYAVMITLGTCTETSNCVNITGVHTTSIASEINCSIYPNPTTGQFTVVLDVLKTPTTIRIFDVLGQTLLTKEVQHTKTPINLKDYSNGTYFIEVNNEKSVVVNKLILTK